MFKSKSIIIPILVLFILSCSISAPKNYGFIDLSGIWELEGDSIGKGVEKKVYMPEYDRSSFIPVKIPGTVREALLKAGKIPDPYYGYNAEKSLWVEEKEWWFCKDFKINEDLEGKFVDLLFEGYIFKGEVWLNGQKVGKLKGMFNPRSFDVSSILNYGRKNTLAVRLEAPEDARNIQKTKGLTFANSPGREQLYSIAQCLFTWDWAPHIVPIGIWKKVKIRYSKDVRIENPYILSSIKSEDLASLNISCEVKNLSDSAKNVTLKGVIKGKGFNAGNIEISRPISLSPHEEKEVKFEVKVNKPRLWWPNGMGEQNLYLFESEVIEDSEVSDKLVTQFGIRELKLLENEGIKKFIKGMEKEKGLGSQYSLGKVIGAYPWTFQINGKKMFAKGANWIPVDHMLRVKRERYDHLLKLAKEANMNLLRVWGGGLYETDDFYELCDEYGILAWQEFLSNLNFSKIDKENFFEGAKASILRIRNHPSLTFYCGGNEFDPDDINSKAIIDYLGGILKELDPPREFHRASPYKGDDHYWGVWHGIEPYTAYRVVRPFRSEAGVNTFPVIENYKKFTPEEKLWPLDTTYIEYHGERNARFYHLLKLMRYAKEFGASSSLEEFVSKSQLYQAIANKFNMEFCRENKFQNSGLLIWQYNDIWPTLSWALVDWYGTPKPSYFFLKRASRPLHISGDYKKYLWEVGEEFQSDIHILNDSYEEVSDMTYQASLLDIDSKTLAQKSGAASVGANKSVKVDNIKWRIPESYEGETFFLSVRLLGKDKKLISEGIYPIAISRMAIKEKKGERSIKEWYLEISDKFSSIFAELNELPEVSLQSKLSKKAVKLNKEGVGKLVINLTNPSKKLAFFIRVRLNAEPGEIFPFYSDNYFTLLPEETRSVNVKIVNRGNVSGTYSTKFEISGWNCPLKEIPVKIIAR